MSKRRLWARPDREFLKREAKELLSDYRCEKSNAMEDFGTWHPTGVLPKCASLSDAQLVLARSYRFPSWARLKLAAELCRAIYESNLAEIRALLEKEPQLTTEPARGMDTGASWGTPILFARFISRKRVFETLVELSGKSEGEALQDAHAVGRHQLCEWFMNSHGRIKPGAVMNPCETLNGDALKFLLGKGAVLADETGNGLAPVALVLETYSRFPEGKHECLEICGQHGIELPDTAVMALHRGRIDLLQRHLQADPDIVRKQFEHGEIYPQELGCGPRSLRHGLHGTPIHGGTLLHIAVDFDETEIAEWLVEKGADVNAIASIDEDGFGGQTPLFGTVVSQPYSNGRQGDGAMAEWLLKQGSDPKRRASIRKGMGYHEDTRVYEYQDVTPIEFGAQFHCRTLVNPAAIAIIADCCAME